MLSLESLLERAQHSSDFTHEELVFLLSQPEENIPMMAEAAHRVRMKTVGSDVHLRAIIEFSNTCKQMCCYCGLRAGNTVAERYRLDRNQILETARAAVDAGYKTLVLQSGEDPFISPEFIADITAECKKMGIAVTLSCGERSYAVYKLWRDAGADRYLIKHECADDALYRSIRPGHVLSERLECQRWLKDLGYQLGSGCMIGLPGQTVDTLARDLELMKEMDIDMCGMGPFIPHADTPMGKASPGTVAMTLKMTAVARMYMPWLLLPATTALESMLTNGRQLAMQAGANVIMPNVSPQEYRSLYQIYPGKTSVFGSIADARKVMENVITSAGFTVATDMGNSVKASVKSRQ